MSPNSSDAPSIPIILLKTRSQPDDNYHAYFTSSACPSSFLPTFIPVLRHNFNLAPLLSAFSPSPSAPFLAPYGGAIFTSQRAVEALDSALVQLSSSSSSSSSSSAPDFGTEAYFAAHTSLPPFYTVGPATSAALQRVANRFFATATRRDLLASANYPVLGKDTGNGEALAQFILKDYDPPMRDTSGDGTGTGTGTGTGAGTEGADDAGNDKGQQLPRRAPLIFFVGEQRRDIIPRTLMDAGLPAADRVRVDEVVVYETSVEDGFEEEFRGAVEGAMQGQGSPGGEDGVVWVVVFSPTGCEAMLKVLGWTREGGWAGDAKPEGDGIGHGSKAARRSTSTGQSRRVRVATIGPTTRDFLRDTCGFEADVCAKKPSPEGIVQGIQEFMKEHGGQ